MPTSNGIPEAPQPWAGDPNVWPAPSLPLLLLLLAWALEPRLGEGPCPKEALGPQGPRPAPPT